MKTTIAVCLLTLVLTVPAAVASAYDPEITFQQGTFVLSFEAGGGHQNNLEKFQVQSDLDLWFFGTRISLLPFRTLGKNNFLYGTFELGLEPIFQRYASPHEAYFAGLAATGRYHFLALGIFVPYLELGAAPGGTNLKAIEIKSDFAFLLWGGIGAQVFVNDTTAVYAGYRMVHVSNGNTSKPNRGFEADTGVAGLSFYFR